jgi:hypothetical protein
MRREGAAIEFVSFIQSRDKMDEDHFAVRKKGGRLMKGFKSVFIFTLVTVLFLLYAGPSIGQEKLVMTGVVKSVERGMLMDVENDKDKSLVSFRIGRKTVYNPRRHPIPGEKVQVEYLPRRGNFVAFTVTILGVEGSKESPKGKTM